jgi:uncharacterized membrane protein
MFETLLSSTALPNLHPAIVHYPIALLSVAFALDLACFVARSRVWLDRCSTLLYVLGTLSACVAYISGQQAAELMTEISGVAQAAMYGHEDFAKLTLIVFGFIASLRLVVSWRARRDKRTKAGALRIIAVVAALFGQILIVATADRGGELVYSHGLGVYGGASVEARVDEPLEP